MIQPKTKMTVKLLDKLLTDCKSKQELDYLKKELSRMSQKALFSNLPEDKVATEYCKRLKTDYFGKMFIKGDTIKRVKSAVVSKGILKVTTDEVGFDAGGNWMHHREFSHQFLPSNLKSFNSFLVDLGISSEFKIAKITKIDFDFLVVECGRYTALEHSQKRRNEAENKRFFKGRKLTKIAKILTSKQ